MAREEDQYRETRNENILPAFLTTQNSAEQEWCSPASNRSAPWTKRPDKTLIAKSEKRVKEQIQGSNSWQRVSIVAMTRQGCPHCLAPLPKWLFLQDPLRGTFGKFERVTLPRGIRRFSSHYTHAPDIDIVPRP